MGERPAPQGARGPGTEPIEGAADGPDEGQLDLPPPTVETTPVGYPSHYLDPPPETIVWA